MAPAKYENATKGEERDTFIERSHSRKAERKYFIHSSIQTFKATTRSDSLAPGN